MKREDPTGAFKAYSICFRFFSLVLLESPNREFLDRLAVGKAFDEWPLSKTAEPESVALKSLRDYFRRRPSTEAPALQRDYSRLFIGPDPCLAPPFASVYLGREKLVIDDPTLEVRADYRKFGLEIREKHRIPDDHLGFELEFLAGLCGRCSSIPSGEKERLKPLLTELHDFLIRNVLPWAFDFVRRMKRGAETMYFRSLADLLSETLQGFKLFLEESGVPRDGAAVSAPGRPAYRPEIPGNPRDDSDS